MDIIIDSEFENLLPPLSPDEQAGLEKSIQKDGCMQPLVIWEGSSILVDGHNRYRICQRLGIPFETLLKQFESREAAMCWMYETQLARRNLNIEMLIYCRGKHYELEKKTHGGARRNLPADVSSAQNEHLKTTADNLGHLYGVGHATIRRDANVARAVDAIGNTSSMAKSKILAGEVKVNKKELEKLASAPAEVVEKVAKQIESGGYAPEKAQKPPDPPAADGEKDKAYYDSIRQHVANLKDPDRDRTCSAGDYLLMLQSHVKQAIVGLEGFGPEYYPEIFVDVGGDISAAAREICNQAVDAISAFTLNFGGNTDEATYQGTVQS